MLRQRQTASFIALLVAGTQILGCATQPIVATPHDIQTTVQVGDTVHVTTNDGKKHHFKVTAVTGDALVGKNGTIAYRDIAEITRDDKAKNQQRRQNAAVGAALVGVMAAAVYAVGQASSPGFPAGP